MGKKLETAKKVITEAYEKHKDEIKEAVKYTDSFSRAAEECFGLPQQKRKKRKKNELDDLLGF